METPPDENKKYKKTEGKEKNSQKTPKNQKETKFMTMILSGFILCCAVKHDVTTKSYMASLHPVKVKASRDTGEILFVDTYAQVTGFSVHSQVLSGPF